MVKKRRGISESELATTEEPIAVEDEALVNRLRANLEEIKTYEGVIGYILRNSTSAAIDLKDPTKIIDYAILSSSALDSSEELSQLLNLGDVKDVIVEGNSVKVVSLTIDGNRISIFLEKGTDCETILRKLR
jgi:predicted regulator of Ras-like GTPase activity (Roadblock/LC7/MglB family)